MENRYFETHSTLSQQSFSKVSAELKRGVRDLFASKRTIPGFILLYSSIDILASLTRPKTLDDTDSTFFKGWVNDYMLLGSNLKCNADDIWGARCGLLHTLTAGSNVSRNKGARMINYIGSVPLAAKMQQRQDPTEMKDLFVSTACFVDAFAKACDRFEAKIKSDTDLQDRVYFHATGLLVSFN